MTESMSLETAVFVLNSHSYRGFRNWEIKENQAVAYDSRLGEMILTLEEVIQEAKELARRDAEMQKLDRGESRRGQT